MIGIVVNCATTLVPFLLGDWYGFVSALCIDTSIFVRWYLVKQNREALDRAATTEDVRRNPQMVKTLCFLRDNKVVTVYAPRNVVINCFLSAPKPLHQKTYSAVRYLGWFSFARFVVTIGQATLNVQLIIVGLTIIATVLTARGTGSDEMRIGNNLVASREERSNPSGRRIGTYSGLDLTQDEEDTMVDWNLVPQRKNVKWWEEYRMLRLRAELDKAYCKPAPDTCDEDESRECTEKAEPRVLPN